MIAANDLASILISRSGAMTSMKLQKLLYYVQAWHAALTDEPLFPEAVKAWKDGPVVPSVWHARKDPETRRAVASSTELPQIDDEVSKLIDLVLGAYGSMSGDELSMLTHAETPWNDVRAHVAVDQNSSEPISVEAMAAFYRANRKLGGRTAADLAAGGIHLRDHSIVVTPFDIDAFLDDLDPEFDEAPDQFGGGNLEPFSGAAEGTSTEPQRYFSVA